MFFRKKQSGNHHYIQLVKNKWLNGKSRQQVIATVGRLDKMIETGELTSLFQSASRFCDTYNSSNSLFDDQALMSTHQVARLLQVSPSTVVGWINQGKLEASRTPGGHRRVRAGALRQFVEQSQIPMPASLSRTGAKRTVFVVDDDSRIIRSIRRSIERSPRTCGQVIVEGCEDGIKALVMIGASMPDLVLLDIYMEGLDGFEVCRRLRQMPRLEKLKIVAMTAHPTDAARARIMDYGALDYWAKPIDADHVADVLGLEEKERLPAT